MMDSPCSSSGSSSTELQNKFRKGKGNVSNSDLHSEVKRDLIKIPRLRKEELVKYMSKLPRFLDKGDKVKAKPLNLGVLDWNTLENWQNYHPPRSSSRYSTSSGITASSLWTDGSSNNWRGDDTFSSSSRKGRRSSLHSYLNIFPIEGHSKHLESRAQNVANYTEIKGITTNQFNRKQSIPRESVFPTKSSKLKLREGKRKSLDKKKTKSSTNFQNYGLAFSKGKWKAKANASKPDSEKLQNQYSNSSHHGFSDGYNDVVLPRPGESADSKHSSPFNITRRSQESKESTSLDGSHLQKVYSRDLYPSTSDSCAITRGTSGSEEPRKEQKLPSSLSCAIKSVVRAKSKFSEEKISIMPTDSSTTKSLKVLNMKTTNTDPEVQNPSPSCRLSSVLNRIRRSYHSRYSADVLQFSSADVTAKSGSNIADSFVCSNTAKTDHSNAGSRDHFSPLKRFLNPLMIKTKVANSRFSDRSPKNSISNRRFSTSFDEQGELSSVHRPKVKLDFTKLRTPKLDETHRNKIKGSSKLQAHFQVSAKNDLPLFRFAVDNSDVLSATLRKFSSRKNDPTWIYTFFRVHEMRRSGGWLSQGSEVKEYVPNVVAQMKVSDLAFSSLGEHVTVDQLSIREFVLYAVDLRLFDHETCDRQPNDELAAIVVKFPRKTTTGVEDSSRKSRVSFNLRDLQEDKSIIGDQELFSTTVLLPGGIHGLPIHGLPSKGEPSPLIERWLSGGQCDCGGWDLGCKVNVFSNNHQKSDGHFELFSQSQEKAEQTTPFFSLSPLKNGIFSVEFDSTLSLLQAFSICVAVSESIRQSELQQPSKTFEEKLAEEARLPEICGLQTPKLVEVDVPKRFASRPPRTPVERV